MNDINQKTDNMTKNQAIFVKYLRIKVNCTWRAVAANYYNRYDQKGVLLPVEFRTDFKLFTIGGNQIDGMFLCEEARKILNEETNDKWD
jgi:hypothetical protein